MIERVDMVQAPHSGTADWGEVLGLADSLVEHLEEPFVARRLEEANQPGQSSAIVQGVFLEEARRLRLGLADDAYYAALDRGAYSTEGEIVAEMIDRDLDR